MNLSDSDPTNDFIQVTDTYHPFCAFGAKGYKFEITDGNGNLMNDVFPYEQHASFCCYFESPAPENPIPHSPIWWDGYTTDLFGNPKLARQDVYTYMLTLYGCNGEELLLHGNIHLYRDNQAGMLQHPNGSESISVLNKLDPEHQQQLDEAAAKRAALDSRLDLFPNPTTNLVHISGIGPDEVFYQVFDEKGRMLSRKEQTVNHSFSLSDYSKGTYYIRIYSDSTYVVRKVIKM